MAKTTTEIDKQLQAKADQFIAEVAKEVSALIRDRFEKYMGGQAAYKRLEFFTGQDINQKDNDYYGVYIDKSNGNKLVHAFNKSFQKSFKKEVVEVMTADLLKKLEIL